MSEVSKTRSVRITLKTRDWQVAPVLTLPARRMRLAEFLPFLQTLGSHVASQLEAASTKRGKPVSCVKGCGACCRQLVAVSAVEAVALSRLVAAMPSQRRETIVARFETAYERAQASGVLQKMADRSLDARQGKASYFRLGIACPFLENEACGIHPDRPLVCREYLATSPAAHCAQIFDGRTVETIDVDVHLSEALLRAGAKLTGKRAESAPLSFALVAASRMEADISDTYEPMLILRTLLGEIGDYEIEAAEGEG